MSTIIEYIRDKIPSFLKGEEEHEFDPSDDKKTLDDVKHNHDLLINKIVTDIISFFMENKNKDEYILELLDPSVCNDLSVYLAKDLEDKFSSYSIDKFQADISISREKHKPCTTRDSCTKQIKESFVSSEPNVSKWELCYAVASHYVKMLNLLAALLTAISPEKNMCIERMNSIYTVVEEADGSQGFQISICKSSGKRAVKDRLFEENGMRELINLYILDYMDKINTDDDIKEIDKEYKKLIRTLNDTKLLLKSISLPETNITESSSGSISAKTISSINNESLLIDKIKSFSSQVKKVESSAESVKIPSELEDDLSYLKEKSEALSKVMSTKERDVSQKVSSILSSYSPKQSSDISSEYESIGSERSSSEEEQQLVLYIGNAYDTLSDIKSSSNVSSQYSSEEYDDNEGSESTEVNENAEVSTRQSEEVNTYDEEESDQRGGYDDKDDSLTKFNNFIKKYKEYWSPEVRKYFDELINNGFNNGVVTDVCNAANVGNKDIFIDSVDIYENITLTDFLNNFNDMKVDYINFCDKIIDILENDLLETSKEKRTIKYSFRKLNSDDLRALQKKCRHTLLEMYTNNHEYYLKGVGYLKRYFTSSFYKKAQTNKK